MKGIIWLWKHQHCWKQLRYLYSHRFELKRILAKVSLHPDAGEDVDRILKRLRDMDRIPLPREWMVAPPLPSRPNQVPAARAWTISPPPAPPAPDKESEQTFRYMDAFNFEGGKEVRRAVYKMIMDAVQPLQDQIETLTAENAELKRSMGQPVAADKYDEVTRLFVLMHLKALRGKREWDDECEAWFDKTIAEFEQSLEAQHDIAEERWMVYKGVAGIEVRQKCDGHEPSLATVRRGTIDAKANLVSTDAQIELMAHAPELADKSRSLLKGVYKMIGTGVKPDGFYDMVEALDNAGVKHCWYEGDVEPFDIAKARHEFVARISDEGDE